MCEKLKIALVTPSLPPFSTDGISSSHYNLFMLLKDKYIVNIYTYNECSVPCNPESRLFRNGLSCTSKKILGAFIKLFLIVIGSRGIVYQFRDALFGALVGLKIIKTIREFEPNIIIVPDQGPTSAFWPKLIGTKIIYVSHHNSMRFHRTPLLGKHSEIDARLGRYLEQCAINRANFVICPSHYMKDVFEETYDYSGPIDVIPNMINEKGMDLIKAALLKDMMCLSFSTPVIYIPSAGSVYKGRSFVIEIINEIYSRYNKEIGFYLSGNIDDQLRKSLDSLPSQVRIFAPGTVANHDNLAYVKACTLCVSPTIIENFSMALLEAQYFGIPVVSFDIGGNCEIIQDGSTGYLVRFPDVHELVNKSLKLLFSEELSHEFAQSAKKIVRMKTNALIMLNKYSNIFDSLQSSSNVVRK
ncbi:MAG: glycosyltransferase family 4 protein [Geobacteraceae bacterium]|nr:glycosyltransferase family 4 protein [Geobacteraceae bacterium]